MVDSVEALAATFTGNPLMTESAFLSVGNHAQHLVGAVESATQSHSRRTWLGAASIDCWTAMQRDSRHSWLRAPADAGLVVVHKACVDHGARARMMAALSASTGETSFGQEDYMSMAIPASERALDALGHMRTIIAGELLVSARALDLRRQRQ